MSFRVRVTPQGARDLERILVGLHAESPQAAASFGDRFGEIVNGLAQFDTSRSTHDGRYRFVNMYPFPYLIFLRKRQRDIDIVAIRHGARNPRAMPARPR